MVLSLTQKVVKQLIENETIREEDEELYIYGLQQGLIIILNIFTTIGIGFIFGMVWQSILFMLTYIPLRTYAGGFHAKTQINCYLFSIALTVIMLLVIKFIPPTNFIILGIALIAGSLIIILAPIEDANKPLDKTEILVYRTRTRIIFGIQMSIIILLLFLGQKNISMCMSFSDFLLGCMLLLGKLKKYKSYNNLLSKVSQ